MKMNLDESTEKEEYPLEKAKINAGWLGRIFGTGKNAHNNIVGMITGGLLVTIIVVMIKNPSLVIPYTKEMASAITALLGYLFGRNY